MQRRKILQTFRKNFEFLCGGWKIYDFIQFRNFLSIFTHLIHLFGHFPAFSKVKLLKRKKKITFRIYVLWVGREVWGCGGFGGVEWGAEVCVFEGGEEALCVRLWWSINLLLYNRFGLAATVD